MALSRLFIKFLSTALPIFLDTLKPTILIFFNFLNFIQKTSIAFVSKMQISNILFRYLLECLYTKSNSFLFFNVWIVSHCKSFSTFCSSVSNHSLSLFGFHSGSKSVSAFFWLVVRLICSLHNYIPCLKIHKS